LEKKGKFVTSHSEVSYLWYDFCDLNVLMSELMTTFWDKKKH